MSSKNQSNIQTLKHLIMSGAVSFLALHSAQADIISDMRKGASSTQTKETGFPLKSILVKNDTLPISADVSVREGRYEMGDDFIHRSILEITHSDKTLSYMGTMSFSEEHEAHHKDNNQAGIYHKDLSPEQYIKTMIHDELSCRLVQMLCFRNFYKQFYNSTDEDKQLLLEFMCETPEFSAYATAIKEKKVNPLSSSPQDFNQEMKFIAQTLKKDLSSWLVKYLPNYYGIASNLYISAINDLTSPCGNLAGNIGGRFKENEKAYEENLDACYTISGINFKQWIGEIPLTDECQNVISMLNNELSQSSDEVYNPKTGLSDRGVHNMLQHLKVIEIQMKKNPAKQGKTKQKVQRTSKKFNFEIYDIHAPVLLKEYNARVQRYQKNYQQRR